MSQNVIVLLNPPPSFKNVRTILKLVGHTKMIKMISELVLAWDL